MEIGIIIAIIAGAPSILVAVLLGYREYKSGSNKISAEVITNYATLDRQQKEYIERCDNNLIGATATMNSMKIEFTDRIANLEGVVGEKDKQLKNLTEILANRNPELEKVLVKIKDFMENIYNANVSQSLILESQQRRNIKIDKASLKHMGPVMRSPVKAKK